MSNGFLSDADIGIGAPAGKPTGGGSVQVTGPGGEPLKFEKPALGSALPWEPNWADKSWYRSDGSRKGPGFLGPLRGADGQVMTEFSVGIPINGKEVDVPTLIPGLTSKEKNFLLSQPSTKDIPESLYKKIRAHAEGRLAEGKSPFASEQEYKATLSKDNTSGLLSDSDIGITPSKTKDEKFKEFMEGATPKFPKGMPVVGEGGLVSDLKRGVGNAAAVADMALGIPGQFASVGADIGGRLASYIQGGNRQQQVAAGQAAVQSLPPGLIAPAQTALQEVFGKEFTGTDVEEAMGAVAKGIDNLDQWVYERTEGKLARGDTTSIANTLMAALGGRGAAHLHAQMMDTTPKVMKGEFKQVVTPDDVFNKHMGDEGAAAKGTAQGTYVPSEPYTRPQSTWESMPADSVLNAEAIAHRLMQEGASAAKVEGIVRKNPKVGAAMEKIRQRRGDVKTSRLGIVIQGEVLDPLGKVTPIESAPNKNILEGKPSTEVGEALKTYEGDPQLTYMHAGIPVPEKLKKPLLAALGAYTAAHLANQDELEAAIAGGLGAVALTKLPRYIDYVKRDWKNALKDTAGVATVTGGMAALDQKHPIEGVMVGMLWGGMKMLPKAVIPKVGNMTIDDLINLRNGGLAASERELGNLSWAIKTAVPDLARREAIATAIDKGNLKGLSSAELKAAQSFKSFTDSLGQAAKDEGVLKDLLNNYVTHIVEREGLPQTRVGEVLNALFGEGTTAGGGASPTSPFAKGRKYETFADLQKALKDTGLQIKTMDIAEIAEIYGKSMSKAVENKKLINALEKAKEAEGEKNAFIMDAGKAPQNYVAVNSPQMRGKLVHPDLAAPLRFVMEAKSHNDLVNGMVTLATAQKRLAVAGSLFHASNLINAYAGARGFGVVGLKTAVDAALEAYRTGGAGDNIDVLLRNGLKIERPLEVDQNVLAKVGGLIDHSIEQAIGVKQGAGAKALGAVENLQKQTFDKLTWDYLHTGMKLAVGMREFERLSLKHPELPKAEIARQVSSFVNDTFGGLDWYRVATESQSQLGRRIGLAALSPKGRVALQIGMFAPDWTLSTFRAMYKALPGSTDMPLTKRLHQNYVMRTAVIYGVLMNGLNIATSGHSIWDNKDPLRIEFRDGTSMQMAKHAMEGPEWLKQPRQTALNKLGFMFAEPFAQLTGKEYLSAEGRAPAISSRTGHVLSRLAPIAGTQMLNKDLPVGERVRRAALGTLGAPIYGLTESQLEARKERRKRERELEQERAGK